MKMIHCFVNLCVFLFFTIEGIRGSELTINVRKNDSVTLVCFSNENLRMCYCAYTQNCNTCRDVRKLTRPVETNRSYLETYFKLSGLEHSDSGLYECYSSFGRNSGKKYKLNVFEDRDPTVVIGTVGKPIVISCCTELDIMATSEKHWCRLANTDLCQPMTSMGPESETRGEFKILDSHGSFSLEKNQLTHTDTGFYKLTQIFQNQTKAYVVELQVKDKPNFLNISPVKIKPKPGEHFEIMCQYSQELQEFSKSWLCDSLECPETVKSVDDRFQSALVLTIDHVACSGIRSFQCVAKMPGSIVHSNVYRKPLNQNPIVDVNIYLLGHKKVQVKTYSLVNLICFKNDIYLSEYDMNRGMWGSKYNAKPYWCRMSNSQCLLVGNTLKETQKSLILQICVTPSDNGTTYRCQSSWWNRDVEIVVIAPPPPQPVTPAVRPKIPVDFKPRSNIEPSVGVVIGVASILLIIILCATVTRFKGPRLRERCCALFARRTPLSAVDIHANTYANSVAHYYSHHHHQVPPPDKQDIGDAKETSSSSDDEFEELPVRPKTQPRVLPEDTDYVRVKPAGGAAPLCGTKQCEDVAQSSSDNKEDDEEDEVTYTHVIIKPKHK